MSDVPDKKPATPPTRQAGLDLDALRQLFPDLDPKALERLVEVLPELLSRKGLNVLEIGYQGPLPPPEMLRQYESVVPGLGRRIPDLWESQVRHRQRLEERLLDHQIRMSNRGFWGYLFITLVLIAVGTYLLATKGLVGVVPMVVAGFTSAATFFRALSAKEREEREKKELAEKIAGDSP